MKLKNLEKKLIEFGKGILIILLFFFSQAVKGILYRDVFKSLWILVICDLFFILILAIIYRKSLNDAFKDLKKNMGSHHKIVLKYWFYGFLVMAFSNIIINGIINKGITANEEAVRSSLGIDPIVMVLVTIICAPIVEEIVFRLSFRKVFSKMIPYALFSGFIFAIVHILASFETLTLTNIINNWKDLLPIISYGALGFSFAAIYYKTKNIYCSMLAHFYHNSLTAALLLIYTILEGFV